jgi:hypothetical protein
MPDYDQGVKNIVETKIADFTSQDFSAVFKMATEQVVNNTSPEDAMNKYINSSIGLRSLKECQDKIGITADDLANTDNVRIKSKAYFLGGQERTISTTSLNMTDLYNFCYDYTKLTKELEKQYNSFMTSCTNIATTFENEIKKGYNNAATQESVYSNLYNGLVTIHELERQETSNTAKDKQAATSDMVDAASKSYQKADDKNVENTKQGANAIGDRMAKSGTTKENFNTAVKTISEVVNQYKNIYGIIFSQKLNAAKQIYKDYMSLLRAHVRDYVGDTKTPDTVQQTGTNYNAGNPQQNNQQGQQQTQQQGAPAN